MKYPKKGERGTIFDHSLYKDDISTPIGYTTKPCTIVNFHSDGRLLIDVVFHHNGRLSEGHFIEGFNKLRGSHCGCCGKWIEGEETSTGWSVCSDDCLT